MLEQPTRQSRTINVFGGLNTTCNAAINEFVQDLNLSADFYPALGPVRTREIVAADLRKQILGALYMDGIYFVQAWDNGARLYLHKDGVTHYSDNGTNVEPAFLLNGEKKMMVGMGGNIVIFPDKVLFNTKTKEFEYLSAEFDAENYTFDGEEYTATNTVGLCVQPDETARKIVYRQDYETAPDQSQFDCIFYSVDKMGNITYRVFEAPYAGQKRQYIEVKPKIRVFSEDIAAFDRFKVGDIVRILHGNGRESSAEVVYICNEGVITEKDNGTDDWNTDVLFNSYITLNFFELYNPKYSSVKEGYDICAKSGTIYASIMTGNFKIINDVPEMDFVVENNNRLWGCSSKNNEIYACALGNPRSWRDYSGVSTDSYSVSVGVYGDFTGAAVYGGTPIFFKDWCILRVYGYYPASFQVKRTECPGIEAGSGASAAVCGGVLYYKGFDGIYGFDGSYPVKVSDALDGLTMKNVSAGACGVKYYFFSDIGQERRLFCYDTKKKIYHERGANPGDGMFVLSSADNVYSVTSQFFGAIEALEGTVCRRNLEWYGVTGDFCMDSTAFQYPVRLAVRFSCEYAFAVEIAYDCADRFDKLFETEKSEKGIEYRFCPIRRCNMFRLRFSGLGDFKLYSVNIITETAGEANHGSL